MHVAGQAIELGNKDRALRLAGFRERCGKFRPTLERVGTLACLDLDMLADDLDPFRLGEAPDGRSLRVDPEPASALPGSRNAAVRYGAGHKARPVE